MPTRFACSEARPRVELGGKIVKAKRGQAVKLDSHQLDARLAITKFDRGDSDALKNWSGQRSFELYEASYTLGRQKNWTPTPGGKAWSANFGMESYSPKIALELAQQSQDGANRDAARQRGASTSGPADGLSPVDRLSLGQEQAQTQRTTIPQTPTPQGSVQQPATRK